MRKLHWTQENLRTSVSEVRNASLYVLCARIGSFRHGIWHQIPGSRALHAACLLSSFRPANSYKRSRMLTSSQGVQGQRCKCSKTPISYWKPRNAHCGEQHNDDESLVTSEHPHTCPMSCIYAHTLITFFSCRPWSHDPTKMSPFFQW